MNANNKVSLDCRSVSYWYRQAKKQDNVLHAIDLKIDRGQIVALVGETGSGKTTLLNLILGTLRPRKGEIAVHSQDGLAKTVTKPGPDRGVVYQSYSLFPYLTALENVVLGLEFEHRYVPFRRIFNRKWRQHCREHETQALSLLAKVKLAGARDKFPHELSGGMRQRVAIAQALIKKPEILLLDEPFGAVDEATRRELQYLLTNLNKESQYTIVVVTHELEEAILVSQRVIALSRHWIWWGEGKHKECPGARIVYDQVSRVELRERDSQFKELAQQRMELSRAAFGNPSPNGEPTAPQAADLAVAGSAASGRDSGPEWPPGSQTGFGL